jgi:hypothetical protein
MQLVNPLYVGMLIVDVSEVKLPGEAKQNNLPYLPNVDNRLTGWDL